MKRQILYVFMLALCAATAMTSCSTEQETEAAQQAANTTGVETSATHQPFAVYAPKKAAALSESQVAQMEHFNDFAFELFNVIKKDGEDQVFSPLSLGYALAMAGLGADGQSLRELNTMLGFEADDRTSLHDLFATLTAYLTTLDDKVSLNIANAFFLNSIRSDVQLNADYRSALIDAYKADCEALDFSEESSLAYINDWCNRQTNGLIPEVLDQLNPEYVSYILNALYFKAGWATCFSPERTMELDFHREDGQTVKTEMMFHEETGCFPYTEDEVCQTVVLPYANSRFAMTAFLPKTGYVVDDVLNELTGAKLAKLLKSMDPEKEVAIGLPKFETEVTTDLSKVLPVIGIPSWFHGQGLRGIVNDLDGTPHPIWVEECFQKARIKVDEEGSEAAAVTVIGFTDGMGNFASFYANHPFVYLITDLATNTILFIGTYHGHEGDGTAGEVKHLPTGIQDIRM